MYCMFGKIVSANNLYSSVNFPLFFCISSMSWVHLKIKGSGLNSLHLTFLLRKEQYLNRRKGSKKISNLIHKTIPSLGEVIFFLQQRAAFIKTSNSSLIEILVSVSPSYSGIMHCIKN